MSTPTTEEIHRMCLAALQRIEAFRHLISSKVVGFSDSEKATLDGRFIDSSGGTPLPSDPSHGVFEQRARLRLDAATKAVDDLVSQVTWATNREAVDRKLDGARKEQARAQEELDRLRGG